MQGFTYNLCCGEFLDESRWTYVRNRHFGNSTGMTNKFMVNIFFLSFLCMCIEGGEVGVERGVVK